MAFPHFYNPDLDSQHPLPSSQFGMENYKQLAFTPTYSNGHWTLDIKLDRMNMAPPWKGVSFVDTNDPEQWKMEPKGKISDFKSVSRKVSFTLNMCPEITYVL